MRRMKWTEWMEERYHHLLVGQGMVDAHVLVTTQGRGARVVKEPPRLVARHGGGGGWVLVVPECMMKRI